MAVKPFVRTATLQQSQPIVDAQGKPIAAFLRLINGNTENVAEAINALAAIPEIREALLNLGDGLQNLDMATQAALEAADQAQQATDSTKRESALQSSYIVPASVLSATPTTITIAAHTRYYSDGTTAAVNGSSMPATIPNDVDYVYYDDPTRSGGAVAYVVTTSPPVQTGDRHVVGAVQIPAAGTAEGGEGPRRPGFVAPRQALE